MEISIGIICNGLAMQPSMLFVSSYIITLLFNQPKKKTDQKCILFSRLVPNLAESFGTPIGDMHCSHRMVAVSFDEFADEQPNTFGEHGVKWFDFSHHIAMGHQLYQDGKMLISHLGDRLQHIARL